MGADFDQRVADLLQAHQNAALMIRVVALAITLPGALFVIVVGIFTQSWLVIGMGLLFALGPLFVIRSIIRQNRKLQALKGPISRAPALPCSYEFRLMAARKLGLGRGSAINGPRIDYQVAVVRITTDTGDPVLACADEPLRFLGDTTLQPPGVGRWVRPSEPSDSILELADGKLMLVHHADAQLSQLLHAEWMK